MKRWFAAIVAALVAAGVLAAGTTLTWEMPTTNVDGSSIPASGDGAIVATVIEYGICTATGTVPAAATQKRVEGQATTTDLVGLIPGREYCVRALAENSYGEKSDWSNTVKRQIKLPVPNAPALR